MPLKTCPVCRGRKVVKDQYGGKERYCSYCGGSGTIVVDTPRTYEQTTPKQPEIKKK